MTPVFAPSDDERLLDGEQSQDRERGSLTVAVVYWMVVAMVIAGLIVDGGSMITAREKAIELAQQAARAEANVLNTVSLRGTGQASILNDPTCGAAAQYLHSAGVNVQSGTIRLDGTAQTSDGGRNENGCEYSANGQTVTVFVILTYTPMLGVPPFTGDQTIKQSASATIEYTGEPGTGQ